MVKSLPGAKIVFLGFNFCVARKEMISKLVGKEEIGGVGLGVTALLGSCVGWCDMQGSVLDEKVLETRMQLPWVEPPTVQKWPHFLWTWAAWAPGGPVSTKNCGGCSSL